MKNILFWVLAVLITLTAVVYQRKTGPTNPLEVKFESAGVQYKTKLVRSLELKDIGGHTSAEIKIVPHNPKFNLDVAYRIYPGTDTLAFASVTKDDGVFKVLFPSQPPAGKLYYEVSVNEGSKQIFKTEKGMVIRFKSPVPAFYLVPHILLMFIGMLLSNYTGLIAFTKNDKPVKYALMVLIAIGVGGLILGPLVQKYAFGSYWTGWPMGGDLTDNKTAFIFIVWLFSWLLNRKRSRRYLLVVSAVLTLLIYSIPHSKYGSEYDHQKGEVVTGRRR